MRPILLLVTLLATLSLTAQRTRLLLDADTANEIDDLYAIAYLFEEQSVDWVGLTSAQWFHQFSGDSTVYRSQALNAQLLRAADRLDLPHPIGADSIMGMPWGGYDPRDSPAARFIIEQARAAGPEKLTVVCIGASTNLASALALAPDITEQVRAYVLGFQYDAERAVWNKDEFNIRRDLNAANYLLNAEGLELHVMPTSTAIRYQFDRDSTFARLGHAGPVGVVLRERWQSFAPDASRWTMWDVALLQAILTPAQATEIDVTTPPENVQRSIRLYSDIDAEAMAHDYWTRLTHDE